VSAKKGQLARVRFNFPFDKRLVISEMIFPVNQLTGAKIPVSQSTSWLVVVNQI